MLFGRHVPVKCCHLSTILHSVTSKKTEILEHTYIRCKPQVSGLELYIYIYIYKTVLNLPLLQVDIGPFRVYTPGPASVPWLEASVDFSP